MDRFIDALYYENLSPARLLRQSEEYQRLTDLHADTLEQFQRTLDEHQMQQFEDLLQESLDITDSETKAYFHAGFCMGARMMQEITEWGS